jgi:hypothetical protein
MVHPPPRPDGCVERAHQPHHPPPPEAVEAAPGPDDHAGADALRLDSAVQRASGAVRSDRRRAGQGGGVVWGWMAVEQRHNQRIILKSLTLNTRHTMKPHLRRRGGHVGERRGFCSRN